MISSIARLSLLLTLVGTNGWSPTDESPQWLDARAGATWLVGISEESTHVLSEPKLPAISIKHISLSLRYTCEMNRRLQAASNLKPSIHDCDYFLEETRRNTLNPIQMSRGGQMVQIHPSQQSHSLTRESEELDSKHLTLFHAKKPVPTQGKVLRGASRWGPDLEQFLEHVTKALKVHNNDLVLSLAIVYLDRASSVETLRSNGALPCPYLSPRTVHRLILVSLIIATRAVYHDVDLSNIASLGIPESQLEHMESWMRQALGDQGLYVMPEQFQDFIDNWERTWHKPKIRPKGKRMTRNLVRPAQQHENNLFQEALRYSSNPQFCQEQHLGDSAQSCYQSVPSTAVSDVALSVWA